MKPLSYSTQWELKVTRGWKKIQYQKIFHIEWKFSWIFENNKIFTRVFETVCTYAQLNTSKPKIKVFSF